MRTFIKHLILFLIFGTLYIGIEFLYRGHSHWTMFLVSGICCLLVGELNERKLEWQMGLLRQGIYGTGVILGIEFVSGCVLNLWLGWNVWDYSNMPFNILGQICLPFALAWFWLALVAIVLDDFLRWKLFFEDKPHYTIFDTKPFTL